MDKLQADKLTEIRKSLEAATPGEWSVEEDDYGLTVMAADPQHPGRSAGVFGFDSEIYVREEDVDLIAHAPEYITYLLQLVETQAQALEEAHTAMLDALSVMEMEGRDFNLMPQCTIQEAAKKLEALTQV